LLEKSDVGIGYHATVALIRESKYRPIKGDVVLIGRQAVYFSPQSMLDLLKQNDVDVGRETAASIKLDRNTTNRLLANDNQELIMDSELFRLLGVPKVLALDHSDYEGAEIIHDLTKPVPPELHGCADFILDGSTLDNVFDPAMVMRNFTAMLRPGGRLITTNVYSNHYEPYVILPPLWFLDYCVVNAFADCKVYILTYASPPDAEAGRPVADAVNVFTIDIDALLDPKGVVSAFDAPGMMATVVIAEKGPNSTSDVAPAQQQYRSEAQWDTYRRNLRLIKNSKRPHLVATGGDMNFFDVKSGHLFMKDDFTARDCTTEILELKQRAAAAAHP
jgi:hypothetical protein